MAALTGCAARRQRSRRARTTPRTRSRILGAATPRPARSPASVTSCSPTRPGTQAFERALASPRRRASSTRAPTCCCTGRHRRNAGHPQRAAELAARTRNRRATGADPIPKRPAPGSRGLRPRNRQQGGAHPAPTHAAASRSLAASVTRHQIGNEGLLGAVDLAVGDYSAAAARLHPLVGRLHTVGRRPAHNGSQPTPSKHSSERVRLTTRNASWRPSNPEAMIPSAQPWRHVPRTTRSGSRRSRRRHLPTRGRPATSRPDSPAAGSRPHPACPRRRTAPAEQRRAARETLTEAIATFDTIGAALWPARTVAELARVSGRAPRSGELTATELRVVDLVGQGLSNRQVAAETFVTVRAVESTLTKVYAKLGVHSRTQLITRLQHTEPL